MGIGTSRHFHIAFRKHFWETDRCVSGDKGFDSKKNQRHVQINRKDHSFIDIRKEPKRGKYKKSVYRRKMKYPKRWKKAYRRRRNRMESKNFSFKHHFGDYIPGKNIHLRRKYLSIHTPALNPYNKENHRELFY